MCKALGGVYKGLAINKTVLGCILFPYVRHKLCWLSEGSSLPCSIRRFPGALRSQTCLAKPCSMPGGAMGFLLPCATGSCQPGTRLLPYSMQSSQVGERAPGALRDDGCAQGPAHGRGLELDDP